ncbi:hypothetical protein WJX72_009376 [[Myrmecia] bisecta]|uniref:ORC1/DEAH AAA+ ATPase domain-containing protein n=1 Tax=[Myrmecia] bisecta TaxID=41462 RepID=A0AAW1P5P1_9CHLO
MREKGWPSLRVKQQVGVATGTLSQGDLILHGDDEVWGGEYTFLIQLQAGRPCRRSVACEAATPGNHFFVPSPHIQQVMLDLAETSGKMIYLLGPSQSGKSTDACELAEKLRAAGFQVVYICLAELAANPNFQIDDIWDNVLDKMGAQAERPSARTAYSAFLSAIAPGKGDAQVVLLFDDVERLDNAAGSLASFMQMLRSLQNGWANSRVNSTVLVGTSALPLRILETQDTNGPSIIVRDVHASQRFGEQEVEELVRQMAQERGVPLGQAEVGSLAQAILDHGGGVKGLTGGCLYLLDREWQMDRRMDGAAMDRLLHTQMATALVMGMQRAYVSLIREVSSADMDMQSILRHLLTTGCHVPQGCGSPAAVSLLHSGAVRAVRLPEGELGLQISAPLLQEALLLEALQSLNQMPPQLPNPPADPQSREFGEWLLEHAMSLVGSDRLKQPQVRTATGQILDYALEHELSRAICLVLGSTAMAAYELPTGFEMPDELLEAMACFPAWPALTSSPEVVGVDIALDFTNDRVLLRYSDRPTIKSIALLPTSKTISLDRNARPRQSSTAPVPTAPRSAAGPQPPCISGRRWAPSRRRSLNLPAARSMQRGRVTFPARRAQACQAHLTSGRLPCIGLAR